eukprot:TRINITY_DN3060_c0_g3_i1.p1 TRINITY_DN3060_c0_g3~~TRINITY_DN3060_c0_g3_i1.p1  ORF type:complete len:334 (-),score=85.61 TRINITY_DN3060_c0_g3_i1:205-1206(-)
MKVVVCGGAGYIGSHVVRFLLRLNHNVVVVDNLSTGKRESLDETKVTFVQADIRHVEAMEKVFQDHRPDAVMHFCADSLVGVSVVDPLKYYENNVGGAIALLTAMQKQGVKYIIFSSTAAIFGSPTKIPIAEDDIQIPTNPYGETKLAIEKMLKWSDNAYGIKYVALRYFNACGADEEGDIGEAHEPETHLIPNILKVALNQKDELSMFGDDYPTPDGTCIRDYIHVNDLATAHVDAISYLMKTNESAQFNLGSGVGYSVKEIVDAARKVTGHPIPVKICPRRAGDPPSLIASSEKAARVLQWARKYESIEEIIATAWKWHSTHPQNYNTPKQ